MIWTPYPLPSSAGSVPILAGGLINTVTNNGGIVAITVNTMTPTGTVGGDSETASPQRISKAIEDGTNIYVAFSDTFPQGWCVRWTISGLSYTSSNANTPIFNPYGFVRCSGSTALLVGNDHSPNYPSVASYSLPGLAATNYNNFPSYNGQLGYAIFDGTYAWAPLIGTNKIFRIDPSTLAATVYTLPGTAGGYQTAFDTRYIYIADGVSDIIIWDTNTNSGVMAGVTLSGGGPCYHSGNLGLIMVSENVSGGANFYTLPLGGGSLSPSIGNANAITGLYPDDAYCLGMCDGPGGNDVWACVTNNTGPDTWNMKWGPGNPNNIVMII